MIARNAAAWLVVLFALAGCQTTENAVDPEGHTHGETDDHGHAHRDAESWAVTSWGDQFEIFAEADPLVAGAVSNSHTHVTGLEDFSALREGAVSAVLRMPDGTEHVFTQTESLRDGIFDIAIEPHVPGPYELIFRVEGAGRSEDIPAGLVTVGDEDHPGGLVKHDHAEASAEEVPFLKEEQWKTRFATAWIEEGRIRESARGTGRVLPAAGGELHVAAPIDGIVVSDPWPFVGLARSTGEPVLALSSRVSQGRTLSELRALDTEKSAELGLAQERLTRLEGLLEVGAVSSAEVDAARARVQTLEAQAESARRQMAAVQGAGNGSQGAPVLEVTAPFSGEVAEILVSPGQAVSAGDPLVRMVRVEPVWVEVHLAPRDAQRLQFGVSGLWVRTTGDRDRTLFEDDQEDLVSIAPEVSPRTGRVAVLLRVDTGLSRLRLGSAVEAEVLLAEGHEGVVIPASAIVDDAGVATAFVQLDGETFERRELAIQGREGDQYLVEGVRIGERIVTLGGAAIRRASLISSGGADHGHVH
jgi:RND family efflux transporter MFP subunit